jgi:hypothetical protein
MALRDAAIASAKRGFRVFPLEANGKKPTHARWHEWASNDPRTVAGWWSSTPDANIGVLTTGMLVVDLDSKNGAPGLQTWMAVYGGFDTLTVRTPSGGFHLYYSGAEVANSQGDIGPGLDIRGHHGYVVAPGSVIDGKAYTVEIDKPIAPAPRAIVALCRPPGQRADNADMPLVALDTPQGVAQATAAVAAFPAAMQGEQSIAAYKLAASVRDYGVSEQMAAALMDEWAARCSPAIGHDDLRNRIHNAYTHAQNPAGAKHPEAMFGKVSLPDLPDAEAAPRDRSNLRLLTPNMCAAVPARSYVVKNLLAPAQIGCVFGAPGAGKSVIAPHVAYAVAQGCPVFGQRTKAGRVLYVAAEDEAGMQERITALRARMGDAPGFQLVVGLSSLIDPASGDLARLQQLVEEQRPSLIVIDTLAASCPGLKENESDSMGAAVAMARSLTKHGAAVLLIHHSPKSGDTPRGHSVLNGALDVSLHVTADDAAEGVIRGQLQKNRNGSCALGLAFKIEAHDMGRDDDGDIRTAPVCAELTAEEARTARNARTSEAEGKALAVLVRLATARQLPTAAPADPLPLVPILDWEEACKVPGAVSDAKRKGGVSRTVREAINGLVAKVKVRLESGSAMVLTWGGKDPVDFHNKQNPHAAAIVGSMRGAAPLSAGQFGKIDIPPLGGLLQ